MVKINQKLTKYNYGKMTDKKNEYIVIHYVGAVSTAKNNADYHYANMLDSSANYFVDESSIWQCVSDSDRAWHCGGGIQGTKGHTFYKKCTNYNSIGIEMCVKKKPDGTWYFEDETVKNTIDLCRLLMKKYGVPINCVIRHFDVTGKLCPAPYINDFSWENFKAMIEEDTMEKIYNTIDQCPEWSREAVKKAVELGWVKGDGEGLNLNDEKVWTIVVLTRALPDDGENRA